MTDREQDEQWAARTFWASKLGDERRVDRLVSMATRIAKRPAGTVTQVFDTVAEREGAFRLLENDQVSPHAISRASHDATALTCRGTRRVFVPIDGSSLNLTDRAKRRELGRVGRVGFARGLHVMSALATDDFGVPIGLLDQRWWGRDKPPVRLSAKGRRCIGVRYKDRETQHWLDTLEACEDRLQEHAPETQAWYQLDRGADCWPVFQFAIEHDLLITIRATHNRRLIGPAGQTLYVRKEVGRQPVLGHYDVLVPRPGRPPRKARMALRACSITIHALVGSRRREEFKLNVVMAEETGRRPDKLRWVLYTTHPVATWADAQAVVHGYTLRWRIEDFHRAWKRGGCNVERNQLRSRNAIIKWATLLAAVAARALRLTRLMRSSPELPASTEFSTYEIDACFILRKQQRDRRKTVRLGELMKMVADLGGFAGQYSGKPPGPTVINRGLERVATMAQGLKNLDEMR